MHWGNISVDKGNTIKPYKQLSLRQSLRRQAVPPSSQQRPEEASIETNRTCAKGEKRVSHSALSVGAPAHVLCSSGACDGLQLDSQSALAATVERIHIEGAS